MTNKSKVTVTVEVDHAEGTIAVKRNGMKCPIAKCFIINAHALAGCYRDAAAYFLDLAAGEINRYELADRITIEDQVELMLKEHQSIFKE